MFSRRCWHRLPAPQARALSAPASALSCRSVSRRASLQSTPPIPAQRSRVQVSSAAGRQPLLVHSGPCIGAYLGAGSAHRFVQLTCLVFRRPACVVCRLWAASPRPPVLGDGESRERELTQGRLHYTCVPYFTDCLVGMTIAVPRRTGDKWGPSHGLDRGRVPFLGVRPEHCWPSALRGPSPMRIVRQSP